MKIFALCLFLLMYVLMIAKPKYRPIYALATAAVYLIAGVLPLGKLLGVINWNVLMMIAGTMIIVDYFIASKMPNLLADILLEKSKNVMWVTIFMSAFSGVISAFIDNVATVLMVAPVGLAVCRKLKLNPVGMILSIAVSSNLQGAATLVGDATSIMLGGYLNMSFNDFIWFHGRPGIIFSVELGALLTLVVLLWIFCRERALVNANVDTKVTNHMPTILMIGTIALLIAASQLKTKPEYTNGYICCALAVIGVVYELVFRKNRSGARDTVKAIDY
jgi:Na+/H+ antiporter NhaD/arsenite permease-like protein